MLPPVRCAEPRAHDKHVQTTQIHTHSTDTRTVYTAGCRSAVITALDMYTLFHNAVGLKDHRTVYSF